MTNRTYLLIVVLLIGVLVQLGFGATTQKNYFAHEAVEDEYGVIAPWYGGLNGQCDYHVRVTGETLKRYPWTDGKTHNVELPMYMVRGAWKIDNDGNIESRRWPGGDGDYGQRAYFTISSLIYYYRYTGDPAAIAHIKLYVEHLLEYTLTPEDYSWPRFPISVPTKKKGYTSYSSNSMIQLDIAAEEGLAVLQAYQLVGDERWLEMAKHWGDVFV